MSLKLFPPHIQQEIRSVSEQLKQLQGPWRDTVCLEGSFNDPRATVYDCYPYFFLPAFPSLGPADIRPLSLAGRLFACSIILYDKVMDRTSPAYLATAHALSIQAMQHEGYRLLHNLFPPDAVFWHRFRAYYVDHAEACLEEQRFSTGERPWDEFDEKLALRIAMGKNGIARATIAGLAGLAQDERLYAPFVEAIDCFNVASQMWDDLCDWKEDLQTGTPSLLLSTLVRGRPAFRSREEQARETAALARDLYYGGRARHVLELALVSLERADCLTAGHPDLPWRGVANDLRKRCQLLLADITRIVGSNLRRATRQPSFALALAPARNAHEELAGEALDYVVGQWRLGFGEARHIMCLSRVEGFSAEAEYHYGDVFQRALVADALCDAEGALGAGLRPVLDYEVRHLLDNYQAEGVGGWCYFPDVEEIAPDADDLGQMMQVLVRAGFGEQAARLCEKPLGVLLRDNTRADGGIETWIIPADGRTPRQERQLEFNRTKWGTGPDVDVMANLLYGLSLYDGARFEEHIRRGAAYLAGSQAADGSWASRWYYGPFYGTYVCLRLFAAVEPGSPVVARAAEFLRGCQHADGGWGMGEESDPLSTSLALVALSYAEEAEGHAANREAAARGLEYLRTRAHDGQGWPSVHFIRPRASEPYGSRTITAAYVLKAACRWSRAAAEAAPDKQREESFAAA